MKKYKVYIDDEQTMGWVLHSVHSNEQEANEVCESLNFDRSYSYVEGVDSEE